MHSTYNAQKNFEYFMNVDSSTYFSAKRVSKTKVTEDKSYANLGYKKNNTLFHGSRITHDIKPTVQIQGIKNSKVMLEKQQHILEGYTKIKIPYKYRHEEYLYSFWIMVYWLHNLTLWPLSVLYKNWPQFLKAYYDLIRNFKFSSYGYYFIGGIRTPAFNKYVDIAYGTSLPQMDHIMKLFSPFIEYLSFIRCKRFFFPSIPYTPHPQIVDGYLQDILPVLTAHVLRTKKLITFFYKYNYYDKTSNPVDIGYQKSVDEDFKNLKNFMPQSASKNKVFFRRHKRFRLSFCCLG